MLVNLHVKNLALIEEENIEKTEKEIIKQLEDIKNGEFSGEDISNSVLSIINSLKGVGDTSTSYINWYFGCLANGELLEPSESVEKIKAVTRERIIEAAKSFELDTVYVMSCLLYTSPSPRDRG